MIFRKHTAFTYAIIGILLPFFNSVCFASTPALKEIKKGAEFFCRAISENPALIENEKFRIDQFAFDPDTDFIFRIQKQFLVNKKPETSTGIYLNTSWPKNSYISFTQVPRPAYYNFLFMFKPFE